MRKSVIVILGIFLCACLGCENKENPAIRIGNIPVTVQEFNDAFGQGRFLRGVELSRKDFLELYITRKLILKEAEGLGLDKDPQILKSLQLFWEQSLLKLALARKINEIKIPINITEEQMLVFYEANKDKDFIDKEFSQVKDEVKLLLSKKQQKQALQEWMESLKKKEKIVIDYKLLGIE